MNATELAIELRDRMNALNGNKLSDEFIAYFEGLYKNPESRKLMLFNGEFKGVFKLKLGKQRMVILYELISKI